MPTQKKAPTPPRTILGIDPGTNVLGYALIRIFKKKIYLVEMGVVTMKQLPTHQHKLKMIFERIQALIRRHLPTEMAIEAPFFGKNVQSMLKLGRAQGVAIAAGMTENLTITEYSPKKIKQSVTGNGNASKEQVAAMLASILNVKLDDYALDATDALATAVCHFYQSSGPLAKHKRYGSWESFLKDNPDRRG